MKALFRRDQIISTMLKIACITFCAIIATEMIANLIPIFAPLSLPTDRTKFIPTIKADPPLDTWVATMNDHPLFAPDRLSQAAIAAAAPAPETAPEITSRLAGMMINLGIREALFAHDGDHPVALKEGEEIDGWTVSKIATDHVVLKSKYGERLLEPTKGSLSAVVPPQSAATPDAIPGRNKRGIASQGQGAAIQN